MASNILELKFRRTQPASLAGAVEQYISVNYDQHPDMFKDDLQRIDELRKEAVAAVEPHPDNIQRLSMYAAQLVYLAGKFPTDIGVDFTWYSSLGYQQNTPMSQNNLQFELVNVLFNLAALYCRLATSCNRSNTEGLKAASNYFCQAAGVLSYIDEKLYPQTRSSFPDDLDGMTIKCCNQLMLAQAQECFWQKAAKDGLKDSAISKLAIRVADLYRQAADAGIASNSITSEWIHHMSVKHFHFTAAAHYRAACDSLEKRKYGEEIARLQEGLASVTEALKEARYINKTVLGDLNGLKTRIQEDLKRAEKDNDRIYLMVVPAKQNLPNIDRANMVMSKVPKSVSDPLTLIGNGELGRPLFARLVPYSVHVAASIYVDRRDRTVDSIVKELDALNARIHELMQSLHLPGSLQALEKPLGLPPGLVSNAEEIRQQNGLERLKRSVDEVEKLKQHDLNIFREGLNLLENERAEDEEARKKYGYDRWTRLEAIQVAKDIYGTVSEIEGHFESAAQSDQQVRDVIAENQHLIQVLSGSNRDLEKFLPNNKTVMKNPKIQREVTRLREAVDSVNRLENKRKRKIMSLRDKAQADDVHPELLREVGRIEKEWPMQKIEAIQFEELFERRLKQYDSDRKTVQDEIREQDKLLSVLAEANTSFVTARAGDESGKEREKTLQNLEHAFSVYQSSLSNLSAGRSFYNDLATLVSKFRDDCRKFAYDRRAEATQLEADINTALPMANLNLSNQHPPAPSQSQRPKRQTRQQSEQRRTTEHRNQAQDEQLAAPLPVKPQAQNTAGAPSQPTQVWSPEMGIKFADGSTFLQSHVTEGGGSTTPRQATTDKRWDPNLGLQFG